MVFYAAVGVNWSILNKIAEDAMKKSSIIEKIGIKKYRPWVKTKKFFFCMGHRMEGKKLMMPNLFFWAPESRPEIFPQPIKVIKICCTVLSVNALLLPVKKLFDFFSKNAF